MFAQNDMDKAAHSKADSCPMPDTFTLVTIQSRYAYVCMHGPISGVSERRLSLLKMSGRHVPQPYFHPATSVSICPGCRAAASAGSADRTESGIFT